MKIRFLLATAMIYGLVFFSTAFAQVTVKVTTPANNVTGLPEWFNVRANAYSNYPTTGWAIYVDGATYYKYSGPYTALNQWLHLSSGKHNIVIRSWANNGTYGTANLTVTVGSANAAPVITVTTPANNATGLPEWFNLRANASSTLPTTGWAIYVDGSTYYQYSGPYTALNQWLHLSPGQHNIVVRCWANNGAFGSANMTVTVGSGSTAPTPIQITTSSLPTATQNSSYSSTLTAKGGTAPYTWSIASGQLPPGLKLSTSGVISGTPTAAGTYTFSVRAKDSASNPQAATTALGLTVKASQVNYLWRGDMETGDMTQWWSPATSASGNYGGGLFNSGNQSVYATGEKAHSGTFSAKLTIDTAAQTSAVRLFRWQEAHNNRAAYYSAWVFIPVKYKLTKYFWNLIQFKSSNPDKSRNDPVWAFYVYNGNDGNMWLSAGWGAGGTTLAGPYSNSGVGIKSYTQNIAPLPVGRWVHLQAYLRQSSGFDGQLTLWMDGIKLFDFQNVRTAYYNCKFNSWCADNAWSVNLYSDGLTPNPAVMYVDDAAIATTYIP